MGHMLFLVKPCEQTDKLPVYEPEVEVEDGPATSESAAAGGASAEQHGRYGMSWAESPPAAGGGSSVSICFQSCQRISSRCSQREAGPVVPEPGRHDAGCKAPLPGLSPGMCCR